MCRAVSGRGFFSKTYADFVARLRVPAGFLLVVAFAWFGHPSPRSLACGIPVCVAGLALRAWAAGHLSKNQQLASSGPYAYTRNPLYLGTLIVATGLAMACRSLGLALLFAAVFVLVYLPVIMLEEQHLVKLFPEYTAYASNVSLLFPWRKGSTSTERFRWPLYWRNQEYQAELGFAAGLLWLIWRSINPV